jgi:hypothetical protein
MICHCLDSDAVVIILAILAALAVVIVAVMTLR